MKYNQEHIYQLLLKRLTDVITEEEELIVQQALLESAQAKTLLDELESTFLQSNSLSEFFRNIGEDEAAHEAYILEPPPPPLPKKRILTPLLKTAAAITILLGLGTLIFFLNRSRPSANVQPDGVVLILANGRSITLSDTTHQQINTGNAILNTGKDSLRFMTSPFKQSRQWNTLQVPAGLTYKLTLSDGSTVRLNATTQLRFPFSFPQDKREVFVDGEAYFTVIAKPEHPFIVHTPKGDITVLGTEFNIKSYDSSFITSLIKGAVLVSYKGRNTSLKEGEAAVLHTSTGLRIEKFNIDYVIAWITGNYSFENTPLEEVAQYIYRSYNTPVVFERKETARMRYSGYLDKNSPIESFLAYLQLLNITCDQRGDTLYFR